MNSTAERLLDKQQQEQDAKERRKELETEWKDVLNRLFSTPDGEYFAKKLVSASGIFEEPDALNPTELVRNKGRREFYLKAVRPYLDKPIRREIEN